MKKEQEQEQEQEQQLIKSRSRIRSWSWSRSKNGNRIFFRGTLLQRRREFYNRQGHHSLGKGGLMRVVG